MVVNCKPEQLGAEVQKQLETFNADLMQELNKSLGEVANKTGDTLKKGGPYKERTGKYTPDWAVKARTSTLAMQTEDYSVHNRKHYQLTHLLEFGHVSRSGSRVRAFPHIADAEAQAETLAQEAVVKAVQAAGGS